MSLPRSRWLWLCVCVCASAGAAERRGRVLWPPAGAAFAVESTLLLNSAERRDRDVGYRLVAELSVAPAHQLPPHAADTAGDDDLLLRFRLDSVQLQARGAPRAAEWAPRASAWGARGAGGAWFARLRRGALQAAYLDPADEPDARDYKKSLLSLFQIVAAEGEHNETDISGECAVAYETLSATVFRKIKRACSSDGVEGVSARRVARYTLDARGALLAVHAEELLTLHGALKARSWHALTRRDPPAPAPAPAAASLSAALDALPPALLDSPLTLLLPEPDDEDATVDLNTGIEQHREALEGEAPGAGGGAGAARALLRLLPALRAAPTDALLAALQRDAHRDLLPGLCRALGLAGTGAAVRAARAFLQLAARDPLEPLAHAFLAGFALAPRAHPDAVLDVLKLGEEARRGAVAESALLAAAAAAAGAGDEPTRAAVRDALARGLARCRDAGCQAVRLLALGNLRADAAETLVAHAERDAPRAAAAALSALRTTPALAPRHLMRLGRLATNASLQLEVRAAALELVVARRAADASGAVPEQLVHVARALHAERSRAAHELRRVLWQRLDALRDAPPVRALLPLLPLELRSLDARAHAGTSSVLRRDTGWGGGALEGWRARLDSVQVAAGGMLRRGAVALLAVAPDNSTSPEIEVEIWTRGLESLAGGGDAAEAAEAGEAEGAAGGLALSVGGARMRDIALFDGQAELLGHVWAGTGSAPAGVLRALRPLREWRAALPLLCGATLQARAGAATAAALDAHAAASLWHRTASGALRLRGALAAHVSAAVRTPWAELRARAELSAEPRLRIALDLDFYDGVALCVRAAAPDHVIERSLELESVVGARRLRVRRGARARLAAPGRTLALGRANDAACRTLRAHDRDDDEPH